MLEFFGRLGREEFSLFEEKIYGRIDRFSTGVNHYADGEKSMTFVSFPHFGFLKKPAEHKESLSLLEYMILRESDATINEDFGSNNYRKESMIVVHQAWVSVLNGSLFSLTLDSLLLY
jgi:hypothetical protein